MMTTKNPQMTRRDAPGAIHWTADCSGREWVAPPCASGRGSAASVIHSARLLFATRRPKHGKRGSNMPPGRQARGGEGVHRAGQSEAARTRKSFAPVECSGLHECSE